MRRILVFVCIVGSVGACVNLSKPEKVAECAASKNGCVNGSGRVDREGDPVRQKLVGGHRAAGGRLLDIGRISGRLAR